MKQVVSGAGQLLSLWGLFACVPVDHPATRDPFSPPHLSFRAVDGCLMLWNFKPQLRAFHFLGHRGPVFHTEFAPSGQLIASGENPSPCLDSESGIRAGSVHSCAAGAVLTCSLGVCLASGLIVPGTCARSLP